MNRNQPSETGGRSNHAPDKSQTDWLAWSLQFALGLLVGTGIGFFLAVRLSRFGFTSFDQILLIVAGVAICCGAFASFHGNRTWMAPSAFSCPEPKQTAEAKSWSILVGYVGAVLVILPVALHLMTDDHSKNQSSSVGFYIFRIALATVPGLFCVHAFRKGEVFCNFGILNRDESPLFFWTYVSVNAIAVMCLLFGR